MKKIRGYPLTRGRVSRQSPRVRGWLPPENILSRHFERYLHDMDNVQNMLGTPFPFFISKKPGEIPIFVTFLAKKSILAYISLKIDIFRSALLYYVIVTSYVDRFS